MIGNRFQTLGYNLLCKLPSQIRNPIARAVVDYRKKRVFELKSPKNLTLFVTNRCNLRCAHCFYTNELNTAKPELSLSEIQRMSLTMNPLETVMITGGEPFLREDILQICNVFYIINSTRRITIPTNGFFTEKILDFIPQVLNLNQKKVLHMQVSIDGMEKVHDKLRGVKNSFKHAIATLEGFVKLQKKFKNLDISVGTTISANNYNSIIDLAELISKEFPTALHKFGVLRGSHLGTYYVPKDIQSNLDADVDRVSAKSPEELKDVFKKIDKIIARNYDPIAQNFQRNKWRACINMLKNPEKLWDCTAGYTHGVVYEDGSVAVCEVVKPFAKLSDFNYNFKNLWNSQEAEEMRKRTRKCYCIHPCNALDSTQYDAQQVINTFRKLYGTRRRGEGRG